MSQPPISNMKRRYFYTDPLAAVWMAKHFGMTFTIEPQPGYVIREITSSNPAHDGNWYIHPDSLPLLEPQLGDVIAVNDPAIDYHGYCFRLDILYRTYADGSYGTDEFACNKSADVRVIQRHCGGLIAFHWPESEAV